MNKTIVLAGNPNVGKSVIFNKLTGRYAVVSNYPGTTVDLSRGVLVAAGENYQVLDTPGTNSLIPVSEDEQVTRDVLFREKPDIIVQVGDAKNLSRTLLLTLELMELGIPMVLALNMYDEARERGMRLDRQLLEKLLGIPVVGTVAIENEGIGELKKQILNARKGTAQIRFRTDLENLIADTEKALPAGLPFKRSMALMVLSEDESVLRYLPQASQAAAQKKLKEALAALPVPPAQLIFNRKNHRAGEISSEIQITEAKSGVTWLGRLGELTMQPFPGYLVVFGVLLVLYEFVGVFAAGTVVDFLQHTVFGQYVNPFFTGLIYRMTSVPLLRDLLVGPYGLISMAVTYSLAIVLPIVGAFFLFFGVLEDSGYLPRLSVMLDRAFRVFGLNGKAVLPMVLGLGCGTMAALSTRILETRKERLLVLLLLSLTIPCSAQLGVVLGLLAGLSWKVTALWLLSLIGSLYFVGIVANRFLPGRQSPFVLEIPPLRQPSLGNILLKVKMRLVWYLYEAVPLFALGTLLLFVMDKTGLLLAAERIARPVVVGLLNLPVQVTQTFILGFLRRDYGAAGLYVLAQGGLLNATQVLVSIVAITLFVPCIAQCFMVVREQGWKVATLILVFVMVYAFVFAAFINMVVRATGIL
jgi:ferrous iron transport protein B